MICLLEPCRPRLVRFASRIKLKHVLLFFLVIGILDVFGAFTHMFELSYDKHFSYPYDGDIQPFIEALKRKKKPEMEPINDYNYSYIHDGKDYCVDNDFKTHRLVFLIKSAAPNFERRSAIRSTWGFQKRFFDVPTKTIFMLGVHENDHDLQERINEEAGAYNDILQANFIDSYYNNTIKTMMGFKWAYYHCRNAKFYMFVDDDMYVSVKNMLRFIRNPAYYPEYLKDPSRMVKREIKDDDVGGSYDILSTDSDVLRSRNVTATSDSDVRGSFEVPLTSDDLVRVRRATAKEKILLRRREGWKKHEKTRMPLTSGQGLNDELHRGELDRKDNIGPRTEQVVGNKSQKRRSSSLTEDGVDGVGGPRIVNLNERIEMVMNGRFKRDVKVQEVDILADKVQSTKNDLGSRVQHDFTSQKGKVLNGKVKSSKKALRTEMTGDLKNDVSEKVKNEKASNDYLKLTRGRRQVLDLELPDDVRLFAGYVFVSSPHRHKTSKWYVPLSEYPFHLWPPYVTAGAYVLSKVALVDMYLTSLYTKHFRFDDIYLGIVAKKADIEPFHCDEFHFYKKDYTKFNYKYVIASHGYGDPEELTNIWNEQKAMGNA
uniref:Hexosyltransferase n=1 Tax=Bracon brevicornis TaxID=1563983 RepID=A0A6V7L7I4_9HYME